MDRQCIGVTTAHGVGIAAIAVGETTAGTVAAAIRTEGIGTIGTIDAAGLTAITEDMIAIVTIGAATTVNK